MSRLRSLPYLAVALLTAVLGLGLATPAAAASTPAATTGTTTGTAMGTTVSGVPGVTSGDVSIQATNRSIRCAQAGAAAGWSGETLVTAVAVALAESLCTAGAYNDNGPTAGCPYGSRDRGAWQINDCYHDWCPDSCAYDLYCNAGAAYDIWSWSGWGAWATYNNGAYAGYLSEARAGVTAAGGGGGTAYGTVSAGGDPLNVRAGPSTSYQVVGSLADGSTVPIYCQTHGEWIYSDVYGYWTDLWDRIGSGQYVSDGYIYTGSNGQVAPDC